MSERQLIAKAFQAVYDFDGQVMMGIKAKRTGNSSYNVMDVHGNEHDFVVGEQINGIALSANEDPISGTLEEIAPNALSIAGKVIMAGDDLDPHMSAIKIRSDGDSDRYLLRHGRGKTQKVNLGQKYSGLGVVSQDQYGNLAFSEKEQTCIVKPKDHEKNLIVFDSPGPDGKGYEAYLNIIKPGQDEREQVGQRGTFYKSHGRRPAKFCISPRKDVLEDFSLTNDKLKNFVIAAFFPAPTPGYTNCAIRSLEDALSERYLFKHIKEEESVIMKEAKILGMSPGDHPDADRIKTLQDKLAYFNKDSYKSEGMYVTSGHELFNAKIPENNHTPSTSYER